MTGRKKDPLRTLTEEEKNWLERISRSQSEPAVHVAHAKEILEVAAGRSYTEAAHLAGKKSGDSVSHLVERLIKKVCKLFSRNMVVDLQQSIAAWSVSGYWQKPVDSLTRRKMEPTPGH